MTQEGESATIPASTSTSAIVSKKKRIRAGYRGYVTKLISDSRDLLDKGPFSGSEAESLKAHLRERQTLLRNLDSEILEILPGEEIEAEVFDCEERQTQILSIIMELESRQRMISHATSANPAQPSTRASPQIPYTESVNLPKLHLSSYNGDPKSGRSGGTRLKSFIKPTIYPRQISLDI